MHPISDRLFLIPLATWFLVALPLHTTATTSADAMLDRVIAQLPATPIQASGTIFVRQRRGLPLKTYTFSLDANWQPPDPVITYTIQHEQEDLKQSLSFQPNSKELFSFRTGPNQIETPLPDLTANIAQTDVSWLDLSLYFLWWRGAEQIGEDTVRGFHCYVIEVTAPENIPFQSYAKVRLWISSEQGLLLQAQGFDEKNRPIRRFWVQSVRQIDDKWMIQTLEIQRTNHDQRTRLQIDDVQTNASDNL